MEYLTKNSECEVKVKCMTCRKIVYYGSNEMQKHREQEGNNWKGFELI